MKITTVLLISFVAILTCCAHVQEPPPEPETATVETPYSLKGHGSLWRQGTTDYFGDRRARRVGDIVTVRILEEASASQEASTETGRSSGLDAAIDDLFGLPANAYDVDHFINSQKKFSPSVKGNYDRDFKGSGRTMRKEKLVLTVTATVVEMLPSGNLRIQGERQVKVNRERQNITLEGIIRSEDISPYNTITSTQIADARIRYKGKGVLGDVQGPGWFARILDWIWPL